MIQYEEYKKFDETVYYEKVPHNPLSHDELVNHFIPAIANALKLIHNAGYVHTDVRVPNICFDQSFNPVLIDYDFSFKSSIESDRENDLKIFAKDVIAHLHGSTNFEDIDNLNEDPFLKPMKAGKYEETLAINSLITKYCSTIQEVITNRTH